MKVRIKTIEVDYQPRVRLQFEKFEAKVAFMQSMCRVSNNIQKEVLTFKFEEKINDLTTLDILPSGGRGSLGVYTALGGEIAINFGNNKVCELFFSLLKGLDNLAYHLDSAVYISPQTDCDLIFDTKVIMEVLPFRNPLSRLMFGENVKNLEPKEEEAPTNVNLKEVEVFWERMGHTHTLGVKFKKSEVKDKFVEAFQKVATSDLKNKLNAIEQDTLYIKGSYGKGQLGVYVAQKGELAVNFGSFDLCSKFLELLNIKPSLVERGDTAIYFKLDTPVVPGAHPGQCLKLELNSLELSKILPCDLFTLMEVNANNNELYDLKLQGDLPWNNYDE